MQGSNLCNSLGKRKEGEIMQISLIRISYITSQLQTFLEKNVNVLGTFFSLFLKYRLYMYTQSCKCPAMKMYHHEQPNTFNRTLNSPELFLHYCISLQQLDISLTVVVASYRILKVIVSVGEFYCCSSEACAKPL